MHAEVAGEIVDADQPNVFHRSHARHAVFISGIITLHIADHELDAGALDGVSERGCPSAGSKQKGFSTKMCFPAFGGRFGDIAVIHRQNGDDIDIRLGEQLFDIPRSAG